MENLHRKNLQVRFRQQQVARLFVTHGGA